MGLRDELRKSIGNAVRAGADAVEGQFRAYNDRARWARVDETINKAAKEALGKDAEDLAGDPDRDPKALAYNPFDLVAAMGYRERPTGLTYAAMEMVGRGMPVVADVIATRTNQVTMFCDLPEDRYGAGFRVRHRDWRTQPVTDKIEKRAQELEKLLLNTGHYDEMRPFEAVSLKEFARQFVPDTLMFDQATFEVVPDRKGRPSYFTIVDPGTIRLLDPAFRDRGDPFAVQVIDGSIVTDFTRDELAFCVRNPRSGIRSFGYGTSELETLVREITGFLWGMEYNRKFFVQGSATKGILNFKGTVPDRHLQAFRRQWYAMVSGVSNAWRTPITNAEDLQWINMQMSNRDMEYSAWMDFLIKIVCARYQIATEEVNFSYGNTGQSQAMGQAPLEEKLKASRDLGLRPLVRWFFTQLNVYFLQRIDPDFEVIPVGLDEKGAEAEVELLEKQTRVFLTVDEARERLELAPLGPDKGGDAILNPTWLQWTQGKQAAAQGMGGGPDGMGGPDDMGGDPGGPGGPEPGQDPGDEGLQDAAPELDLEDAAMGKSERDGADRPPIVRYMVDL